MRLAYLPSPARGVWHLGPFPIRAYALCILLGIAVALAITDAAGTASRARLMPSSAGPSPSVWLVAASTT